jgi:chaperone modulatory protein CbpM
MAENRNSLVTGILFDEVTEITFDEITRYCAVEREKIVALVSEGIIEPRGRRPEEWRFTGRELSRAKRAVRIENDLDVNLNAVAIILDLLDRIDELRAALERGGR